MAFKFYVGDLVETIYGIGRVLKCESFIDVVKTLEEYEVDEFLQKCQFEVGLNYKDEWCDVFVKLLNGRVINVQGKTVKILEGRDVDQECGLEAIIGRKSAKRARIEQIENKGGGGKEGKKAKISRNRFKK